MICKKALPLALAASFFNLFETLVGLSIAIEKDMVAIGGGWEGKMT
jgi:hypothetical protein